MYEIIKPETKNYDDIYFSMELFDGDLLKMIRTRVKVEKKMKISLLYQSLNGLNFIHKSGVIHRDIRPKNILVNIEKDHYRIVLCDFGLSR